MEIMEEQTFLLANKFFNFIMQRPVSILVCLLFFVSCVEKKDYYDSNISENSDISYKCDSSINNFILRDTMYTSKFDKINDIKNDFSKGEGIWLANASFTEFLFMKTENGGCKHQFNYFYLTDSIPNTVIHEFPDSCFITTKGARLNMTEDNFLINYGDIDFDINKSGERTIYSYYDSVEVYQSIYIFRNRRLSHVEFGYIW